MLTLIAGVVLVGLLLVLVALSILIDEMWGKPS